MIENLLPLWLAALPLMGSPGPATLSSAAMGTAFGMRASLPYVAGICLGTATVLLLIATGISGLIFVVPGAVPVITVLAAAYILYLAWRIATAPVGSLSRDAGAKPAGFVGGYLLAVANPKAFAVIGAVFSSHHLIEADPLIDAAAKIAALFPVIVGVNLTWLAFGSLFARWLDDPVRGRVVNVTFAVLLVVSVAAAFI
ncbi:MAG: LysE family translocator [Thalassobaculaceae bacterium]|nr:LysE family translocator [Thalassobaculaceae bacterium]